MQIVIADYRKELREARERVNELGEHLPDTVAEDRYQRADRSYDQASTVDTRTVEILFEDGDDVAHGVPSTLDTGDYIHYGRQTFPFLVRRATIVYKRDQGEVGWGAEGPEWKRHEFKVNGPNLRKDGTTGEKPQTLNFPTRSYYGTGVYWTEDDITVASDHYLYKPQRARVGKEKTEDRYDPLPQWLAAIEARVSPKTGVPFTHGDVHRFGNFALVGLPTREVKV